VPREPLIILMAGPTASGKSSLALALAQKLDGVIVNADSMQVYQDLRVLTARPGVEDEAMVPHSLYGFVEGGQAYSTGKWLSAVRKVLADVKMAGKSAIITGGTGLYFKTLEGGLSPVPDIPDEIRNNWRQRLVEAGAETLHGELVKCDPGVASRLEPGDGQRIVRALEVLEATGESLNYWREIPGQSELEGWMVRKIVLALERDRLYQRCDLRFDQMIERGALEEVRHLQALELDPDLPVMKALGVPQLLAHVAGTMSLDDAAEHAKRQTRRYAKRQMTWFRGQMADWPSLNSQDGLERLLLTLEL
jgi:tRNA dimethylallyltransferase